MSITKLELLEKTLKLVEETKSKNLKSVLDIDKFIDTLKEYDDANRDEYIADNLLYSEESYRIDSVADINAMFADHQLPIDYDDYDSIDYFMSNIKECNDYAFVDLNRPHIVKWEDIFDWLLDEMIENLKDEIEYENDQLKQVQ